MTDEEEDRYNGGLKIRDVARILGVHDNTVRNMMDSGRLEWYYLNGRDGNRRVIVKSLLDVLLSNTTVDWCGLCNQPLSKHTAGVENITVNGRPALRPIGWMCPTPAELKEQGNGKTENVRRM